jgi:hypothetical protein
MTYRDNNLSLIRASNDISNYEGGEIYSFSSDPFSNLFFPYILDNGGDIKSTSLTVNILNKAEEFKAPNNKWFSKDRFIGDLSQSEAIWGFKETRSANKSTLACSNGYCFSGQTISIYIAKSGHSLGYIGDEWIYCKHNLKISCLNLLTGENTNIADFNDFTSNLSDESRYFEYKVPEANQASLNSYNFSGLFSIRLEVTNKYYYDASFEKEYTNYSPKRSLSLLHLLAFSASEELKKVPNTITKDVVNGNETLIELFDKITLSNFEILNKNELSDSQKRAIVAEQIAFIFSSQHPVVTADYFPSPIIGYETENQIQSEFNNDTLYYKKHPNNISLEKNRLFGMMTSYKNFNYAVEFDSVFDSFDNSTQTIRDPQRTFLVDDNGRLSDEFGVNGILFNPYVVELKSASPIFNHTSREESVVIEKRSIDIDNIVITNRDNAPLKNGDNIIKASFRAVYGEENIKRIRYSFWTKNNKNYNEFIDATGQSRSETFNLYGSSILCEENNDDIVKVRIDIEDYEGNTFPFYKTSVVGYSDLTPSIYDICAYQDKNGSGIINIEYTFNGEFEIDNCGVSISYSLDGAEFTAIEPQYLSGDFGYGVHKGKRKAIWYAREMLDENTESCIVKLYLENVDINVNSGKTLAIAMVDFVKPEVYIKQVSEEEQLDEFMSSSSSSSSSLDSSSSSLDSSSSSSDMMV